MEGLGLADSGGVGVVELGGMELEGVDGLGELGGLELEGVDGLGELGGLELAGSGTAAEEAEAAFWACLFSRASSARYRCSYWSHFQRW